MRHSRRAAAGIEDPVPAALAGAGFRLLSAGSDASEDVGVHAPIARQPGAPPWATPAESDREVTVDVGDRAGDQRSPAPPQKTIDIVDLDSGARHRSIAEAPAPGCRIILPLVADRPPVYRVGPADDQPAPVQRRRHLKPARRRCRRLRRPKAEP